jgi:hypothetical protein
MVLRVVAGHLLAVTPVARFGEKMRGVSRALLASSSEEPATGEWRGVRKGVTRVMRGAESRRAAGRVTKVASARSAKPCARPGVAFANLPGPGDWWMARHTPRHIGGFMLRRSAGRRKSCARCSIFGRRLLLKRAPQLNGPSRQSSGQVRRARELGSVSDTLYARLYPHSHRPVVFPTFLAEWTAPAGISSSSPTFGW